MSPAAVLESPRPPRSPWQLFYGAVHRARRGWHRKRARRLPRPVISVGNLHWGGGGKTPLVAAIAAHLRDRGRRVAILSRGYRSRGRGVRLVSDGDGPMLGPLVAGDEPVLLASRLRGVAVLVGPDRHQAGVHALERLTPAPEIFVLDDGFSHLRLHRDLDLLAFPAADVFAGGRLFPGGRLREPLASSAWADAAILTGSDDGQGAALAECLRPFGFRGPGFASRTQVLEAVTGRREPLPPGASVVLVVGVARPQAVEAAVRRLPYRILEVLTFTDHHRYPEASLERIRSAWRRRGADSVLATEKDGVKLLGRLGAPLAVLPTRAEPEPAFWKWLDGRLETLGE